MSTLRVTEGLTPVIRFSQSALHPLIHLPDPFSQFPNKLGLGFCCSPTLQTGKLSHTEVSCDPTSHSLWETYLQCTLLLQILAFPLLGLWCLHLSWANKVHVFQGTDKSKRKSLALQNRVYGEEQHRTRWSRHTSVVISVTDGTKWAETGKRWRGTLRTSEVFWQTSHHLIRTLARNPSSRASWLMIFPGRRWSSH